MASGGSRFPAFEKHNILKKTSSKSFFLYGSRFFAASKILVVGQGMMMSEGCVCD